jgi:hypothetical protein
MSLDEVEALTFDVFGTVVDWRTGVAREMQAILGQAGPGRDWEALADRWRARYQPAMEAVRSAAGPGPSSTICTARTCGRCSTSSAWRSAQRPSSNASTAPGTGSTPGRTWSQG